MIDIRVWAPHADHAEVEANGHRQPMRPDPGGWWELPDGLPPETDYAFVLDRGETLPDPRSPHQPHGVHGASRTVPAGSFPWTDQGFRAPPLASGLVYELHIGTFSPEGTFDGAIARLDRLRTIGVTHIELMPVHAFPGERGWGYDPAALFAPHQPYGGPQGLARFVDACHARGLAVLLDVVYNHLGPDGNYLDRFGPYFTDTYDTPWGKAVNLDGAGSDEVRRFLCDNALMWLRDYHIDGLRIDAIHALRDASAKHFLEQLSEEVDALEAHTGRPLALIAESDLNDPRVVRSRDAGGFGIDAQWSDDLHHALHAALTGEQQGYYEDFGMLADVAKALEQVFVNDGVYSRFRHRRHGRPPVGLPGDRFVGYLQTHDQVGNRARGDRIGQLVSAGRQKMGTALVMCSPFVPMLFQGEEWNASTPFCYFTDHQDDHLAEAVRKGRRGEFAAFGWRPEDIPDPQDEQTFRRCRLDWTERERSQHRDMLEWYEALIRLRRERPDLGAGRRDDVRVRFDEQARWLVLHRSATIVACNLSTHAQPVPLSRAAGQLLLSSGRDVALREATVDLPPDGVAVIGDSAT